MWIISLIIKTKVAEPSLCCVHRFLTSLYTVIFSLLRRVRVWCCVRDRAKDKKRKVVDWSWKERKLAFLLHICYVYVCTFWGLSFPQSTIMEIDFTLITKFSIWSYFQFGINFTLKYGYLAIEIFWYIYILTLLSSMQIVIEMIFYIDFTSYFSDSFYFLTCIAAILNHFITISFQSYDTWKQKTVCFKGYKNFLF